LGKVPGLLGTSKVTEADMEAAKGGYYKDKADERLRQLGAEALNKADTPEDPRDWARRMGMDENADPKAIYYEAQRRWEDSSLFAGGRNLDLIRWDVVQADRSNQEAAASGQRAILDYAKGMGMADQRTIFGRNGQGLTLNIPGLLPGQPVEKDGYSYQPGVGAAVEKATGAAPADEILPSAEDAAAAADSMIGAIQTAFDTDYARTTLAAVGESTMGLIHAGYVTGAPKFDWTGPIVDAVVAQLSANLADLLTPPAP
jgi:hypothetical protein